MQPAIPKRRRRLSRLVSAPPARPRRPASGLDRRRWRDNQFGCCGLPSTPNLATPCGARRSVRALRVRLGERRQHADAPHLFAPLLRPCRQRPRCRRAAEQRDELATAGHSITSSARASTVAGTSRPSALAVLRLITSSYLVGACTGRLAGFSPLRIRST